MKQHFRRRIVHKSRDDICFIIVFQWTLMLTRHLYNRHGKTFILYVFIRNIIKSTKRFPPIFKIIDIIAVPDNTQSIGLVEFYPEMFGMLQDILSFKQFFFSYHTQKLWRSEEHTSELQSRPHLVCR